jgi:hypothetical protein
VPASMRAALEDVTVSDQTVRVRFREVDPVELTPRGSDREAACVLENLDGS